ncbi:uncharacterized protein EV422DRAFT_250904 [Fimicolochytrium jonesii]|uniref:uncharacterized protein n=1 Tax=Fimicolochytrium jonesii TaxID=1396493 RepID=UPI0022FE04E9|nr:uncharacterized protein EV422DRAFT_250904 [Fimicolochytrium jonesii]KAI8825218.1 hypothetical protein EV422DRAFT_250904 [Fimicolochytrium jonesii]
MNMSSGSSFLDQLQNQLHPDSTPQSSDPYHDDPVPDVIEEAPEPVVEAPPTPEPERNSLDMSSQDLFPALPVATPGKTPLGSWAAKGPSGQPKAAAGAPSRPGAPTAGGLARPKKATERLEIPSELQAPLQNEKGKSVSAAYVCKQITSRHGTSVDLSTNSKTGTLTIIISGKPEAVKQTKREIINSLTLQVKETVMIPISVRRHLVGKAGANIKSLMARTMTKIDMPRTSEEEPAAADTDDLLEDEPEQEVIIIGDYEGVEEAKKAVDELVAQRTSKRTLRMNVERSYYPFIAGPNGSQVQLLELETNTRIHIPPTVSNAGESTSADIKIIGERSAVLAAEERLKAIYEQVKRTTRTLQIPVKKRQHRFIIGPKGVTLQEIFEKTGCHVDLPLTADPSDIVTIRGPDEMLSTALQLVIEKSNSIIIDEVDVGATIASSVQPELFMRFLYTKERAHLKSIESEHNVTIQSQKSSDAHPVLEIQGKTKSETDAARAALYSSIKEWGETLCFGAVEIPSGLHKFVIGKKGQNIANMKAKPEWNGRFVDVVVAHEADASDEVIIVVKRAPTGKAKGNLAASDEEALKLVDLLKKELESQAQALADLVTLNVNIDSKYHGRLIGTGGAALKELLSEYNNAVTVKFPKSADSSKDAKEAVPGKDSEGAIVIRGPKKEAHEVQDKIQKQVAEWRHVELMSSFTEVLKVPKGLGKRLVGNGKDLKWAVSAIREKIASGDVHKSKVNEKELAPPNLNLRAEVEAGATEDTVTLYGPKTIVELAKGIVAERAKKLADTISEDIDLFAAVSAAARKVVEEAGGDIRRKVLRRIIGKEGKGIKKLTDKHGVQVRFVDRQRKQQAKVEDDDEDVDVSEVEATDSAPGNVVIKGSKSDVGPARDELVALVEHELLNSSSVTFQFPRAALPHIVGRHGAKIQKIKDQYNVRIDFNDIADDEASTECVIEGSRQNCQGAAESIKSAVDDNINVESVEVQIPSYLHKLIIGPGGARIRAAMERFGGQDRVKVQFPQANMNLKTAEDAIVLKGNPKLLPDVRKELGKLVNEGLKEQATEDFSDYELVELDEVDAITEVVSVPSVDVPRVAGRFGDALVDMIRKLGVTIWFRDGDAADTASVHIVARHGKEKEVQTAKNEISSKIRTVQSVPIPEALLEKLRSTTGEDHAVEVASLKDIAKRVKQDTGLFPELDPAALKGEANGSFVLRGDTGVVAKVVKKVENLLKDLANFTHSARIQLDADLRPHIIGRQGQTINRLREESGADIDLIRGESKNVKDVVVIRGTSSESVQHARELINNIVQDQAERIARDREREEAERERAEKRHEARIDDEEDVSSERGAESSSAPNVPGWSGRAQVHRGGKGRKLPADGRSAPSPPSLSRDSSTGNYWSYVDGTTKKKDEGWQAVPTKKAAKAASSKKEDESSEPQAKKGLENLPSEDGASSAAAKKKKNKKKKAAGAADTASVEALDEKPAIEVSKAPPATTPAPAKPAPTATAAPAKPAPVTASTQNGAPQAKSVAAAAPAPAPAAKVEKKAESAPAVAAPATALRPSSPAKPIAPKDSLPPKAPEPAPAPAAAYEQFEELPKQEDEWQTVKKFKQAKLAAGGAANPAAATATAPTTTGASKFGAVPTMPSADDDEEAAKKKKKNKNKKKKKAGSGTAEAAVVMPGDEE